MCSEFILFSTFYLFLNKEKLVLFAFGVVLSIQFYDITFI